MHARRDCIYRGGSISQQERAAAVLGSLKWRTCSPTCGCRIGHPQEVTWAFSWISPAEPVVHRRPRPGGDAAMITGLWGGRVVASAGAR